MLQESTSSPSDVIGKLLLSNYEYSWGASPVIVEFPVITVVILRKRMLDFIERAPLQSPKP